MSSRLHLALHCAASVGLACGLVAFDSRQGEMIWALTEGVDRMPKPRYGGPVLRVALTASAALAGVLALEALADGRLKRHRDFERRVPPFADAADAVTVALLVADLVALANAAATARHISDLQAVCARWVAMGIIPAPYSSAGA